MSYPNYGPSPYGPPLTHPNGTTILILGILSLVVCSLIGPFAWVMGNRALREIDSSGYMYENRGHVQAGRICGIVGTCLMLAVIGLYAFFALIFGGVAILDGLDG
ncbi:DUF4190 domain-containing protein [Nonomuraea muscovyensis]|jgi:hypothetical protein|uniref:DUF4190 domain-containing protein n=1 Tax=Nonomuraea muscovyensis TaxID=1124761 RepID=A0A7X0CBP7_9ACTN|nr:DUF4190 domain-containing protein [Nonomuraea muscovyensis]MBB6352044.1 hypothetical protein [Nonomuraea muscovyensis]MDF2706225.1 hypothetical protein [Nonomuraea muscovyensis]